ncbi:hypothetical protein Pan241w_40160 [Gimesia alba]|uniref:Uncharacterized protein n=1 Tax=Gimesia alba TaxID=2527973 RepID=A0A517RJ69_9PLAN|nr:hypothetical protein Pan241w_40160 [Gimesia alba]
MEWNKRGMLTEQGNVNDNELASYINQGVPKSREFARPSACFSEKVFMQLLSLTDLSFRGDSA